MTPDVFINELEGIEKIIFKKLYSGGIAKKMYRMYEYTRSKLYEASYADNYDS